MMMYVDVGRKPHSDVDISTTPEGFRVSHILDILLLESKRKHHWLCMCRYSRILCLSVFFLLSFIHSPVCENIIVSNLAGKTIVLLHTICESQHINVPDMHMQVNYYQFPTKHNLAKIFLFIVLATNVPMHSSTIHVP